MKTLPLKIFLTRLNNPFFFYFFILFFSLSSLIYLDNAESCMSLSLAHLIQLKLWTVLSYPFLQPGLPALFISFLILFTFTRKLSYQIPLSLLGSFFWKTTFFSGCMHLLMASEKSLIYGVFPHCIAFSILFGHYHGTVSLKETKKHPITWNTLLFIFILLLFSFCALGLLPGTSIPSLLGAILFAWIHIRKVHNFNNTPVETYAPPSFTFSQASPPQVETSEHVSPAPDSSSPFKKPNQEEIDKVLDKILEKGISSLTENEKNILKNASQKTKV